MRYFVCKTIIKVGVSHLRGNQNTSSSPLPPLQGNLHFLPDILVGGRSGLPDGRTFLLVVFPAGRLAGPVAVMGKPALSTAVQIGPTTETAVAHLGGQTERQ